MLKHSVLITIVAGIALALATSAVPRTADLDACSLISTGQLGSILGLQHVKILKDIPGTSAHDNTAGVTHSVCNGVAWSGTVSQTPSGVRAALANGTGAAFAIDTWAPDDASSYVHKWKDKGYDDLTANALTGPLLLPTLPVFKPFHIHRLVPVGGKKTSEDEAMGETATQSGIRAVEGTWWADKSSAAVSIAFEDSASNETVAQLNQLAKIAVAAFGLDPVRLRLQ